MQDSANHGLLPILLALAAGACSSSTSPSASTPIVGEWAFTAPDGFSTGYFFNADGSAAVFDRAGCNASFGYTLEGNSLTLTGSDGASATIAFSNGNDSLTVDYTLTSGLPGQSIYIPGPCAVDSGVCTATFTRVNSNATNTCPVHY